MAKFEDAIGQVLTNEGGYVNDPTDPGGETKYGITKRTYPNLDIANLTTADAEAIYKRDFWRFDGIIYQNVANKLFDASVNMGHNAIKIMQRVVGTAVDGVYGHDTEAKINAYGGVALLIAYRQKLASYYLDLIADHPALAKYKNGWLKRAAQ